MKELLSISFSYLFLQTIGILLTALLIPKLKITSIFGAFLTVIALAILNTKVWDAALFFKIPDQFTMHALLLFLSNGILFWILVKALPGIEVEGIMPALVAPVVFTIISLLLDAYADQIDWAAVLDFLIKSLQALRDYFNEPPAPGNQESAVHILSQYMYS